MNESVHESVHESEQEFESEADVALEQFSEQVGQDDPVEVVDEVMVLEEVSDPELLLPVWEATGNGEVDSALELIQVLDSELIHEHAEVLGEVHGRLHGLMANLDR